jgi:cytidyltransferase-like protein
VIVGTHELDEKSGCVTMVDGGFDPLHPGHIAYFRAAASLGLPVLCNVAPDAWIVPKHRPLLPQSDRGELVDAIRWIDFVHLAQATTAEVLRRLRPRFYAKGIDWEGRLPPEEVCVCREHGIEVVFLDTVRDSSTAILVRYDSGR